MTVRADGRAICHACADRENMPLGITTRQDVRDPVLAAGWRKTFIAVLTEPRTLAAEYRGPIGPALRMGLLWAFMGHLVKVAWLMTLSGEDMLLLLRESDTTGQFSDQVLLWTPWIAVPFVIFFRMVLGFLLFHAGLRIAGAAPEQLRSHARAYALANITLLFAVIPVFGPMLATFAWFNVVLGYARRSYGMSTWRAALALSPCILFVIYLTLLPV